MRYIASFGAYAPPNSKLCLRAVGEPWFEFRGNKKKDCHRRQSLFFGRSGGIFTGGEYSHACRLQASLTCSALRMRTHHRFAMMCWSPHRLGQKEKHRQPKRASYAFWSKRRDSNPRSPVPETGAIPPSLRLEIKHFKSTTNIIPYKNEFVKGFLKIY